MSAADDGGSKAHILIVTPHDYNLPGAVTSRHLALARGLSEQGVATRFLVVGSVDIGTLRRDHIEYSWQNIGVANIGRRRIGPVRGLPHQVSPGLLAVLCVGRDPLVLRRGRQAAHRVGAPALLELTEFPDVVVPHRRGRALYLRMLDHEIVRMDGVVTISSALCGWVKCRSNAMPVFELPMIVDMDRFPTDMNRSSQSWRSREALHLGYAGSLKPAKDGLDLLLRALASIPDGNETPRPRLTVWGDGPDRGCLEKLARDLGLAGQVSFAGMIPTERVPAALTSADCMVLPRPSSRQALGGFPTKLGEYLASARPVITTTTGDIPRKLFDGEAVLVPPDDVTALADAINWVVSNRARARAVGYAGRLAAEREFAADRAANKLLSAIAEVRRSGPAGRTRKGRH